MIRGKREFEESAPVGKNKKARNGDSSLQNDNTLIIKRKVKCITSPQCQKIDLKEKVKPADIENKQTSENANVLAERNNNSYECQFERLNMILKESSHFPTLTQNELRILFMKYKLDGHFEANKNLPFHTTFLNNQQNRINYGDNFYNEARCTPTVDTQYLNCRDNEDTFDNLYYNNANGNQQNFKYNTYKHPENHTNEIYDYFPSGSANTENIFPEANNDFEFENNTFPYNAQYEHFQNVGESSQKYDNTMQYIDQPWNLNISNNFQEKNWDSNMSLPNRNDNYQLWRSENSDYIPETNNSEWQYGVKNHVEPHVWNMHSPNTNYPPMNNENLDLATTINYNDCMHQDINTNTSASSVASNNFSDPISFLSSFTDIIN
ncbi:uncharacterized protein LOC143208178 isoform X2 [Lasioglossum baleicum]|uniref:uncharacterized protein LOC143208178 isoform X2 n=1 Tax=Lasioglossum baleicum TaxID=434251 RepID=UPI003FCE7E9A